MYSLKQKDGEQKCANKNVETVNSSDDEETNTYKNSLNYKTRRAYHCSLVHNNYLYVLGGYSFSFQAISFISRLNMINFKWEHFIDRRPKNLSSNRSNRWQFSNQSYKPKQTEQNQIQPSNRYAHSCALDKQNVGLEILF